MTAGSAGPGAATDRAHGPAGGPMPPRQLVLAAGRHERVDRIPVTPYMGNYGAVLAGVPIDRYCTDASAMAQAQLEAQRLIGQDMLVAQSDGYYMAEALGMRTYRRPGTTPAPQAWPVADLASIDALRIPDPRRDGRMPVYLDAVRMLRDAAGERLAVRACGTGAFSLAGHLMGPDRFVLALALLEVEPDPAAERRLRLLMEITTETTTRFALAALEAGADVVMDGDSLASLDMISPQLYERWAWPFERAFFERVRPAADASGALTLLHICGDTTPILPLMARTGAHILEIDWKVELAAARDAAAAPTDNAPQPAPALMGNLDPTSALLQGSPGLVLSLARAAIRAGSAPWPGGLAGVGRPSITGFLLGSGCEVAPGTPPENMRAMVRAC